MYRAWHIQSTSSHHVSFRYVSIIFSHPYPGHSRSFFPSGFQTNILYVCYIFCPFQLPWLNHSKNIWSGVQIMKTFIIQLSHQQIAVSNWTCHLQCTKSWYFISLYTCICAYTHTHIYNQGVLLTTHPLLVPWSWKSRAIPLPTLWATPGLRRDH